MIYLTLLLFIIMGIGANCRTPPIAGEPMPATVVVANEVSGIDQR